MATAKRPGRPKKDDMIFWGVRLDQETVKRIREEAKRSGATQGDIIREALNLASVLRSK
jgi:hypothetical protein